MSWDGKMYNMYKIEHTDGMLLKGKKYFVLRLDSDDPVEAARVAAAMRAYKIEPRNCDVGTAEEQGVRFKKFCNDHQEPWHGCMNYCPVLMSEKCAIAWAQLPYKEGDNNADE